MTRRLGQARPLAAACVSLSVVFGAVCGSAAPAHGETRIIATDVGASPDATDNGPALQAAIDRLAAAGGGELVIPDAARPYRLRTGLTIAADDITITGAGATLLLVPEAPVRAGADQVDDVIQILGDPANPADPTADNITIRGLTIDANYWNQPGSYNPRGIDSDHATGLLIENVTITRAFVGLTFGLGVSDSEARGVAITRWYDDAFNASADGITGGTRDIRFVRCVARNSPNETEGGLPGSRNNAWEIEDGTLGVTLIDCVVRDCGGNGFAVRNHTSDRPVATRNTTLIRCRAEGVTGLSFHVRGQWYPNAVEGVTLDACDTDGVSVFVKDIRALTIIGSAFGGTVTMGPCRDARIERTSFASPVRIWSQAVGDPGEPDETGFYRSSFEFVGCSMAATMSVFGDSLMVRTDGVVVAPSDPSGGG